MTKLLTIYFDGGVFSQIFEVVCAIILGRKPFWVPSIVLPLGGVENLALPVLFLLTGRFSGFSSPRRGDTLRRSRYRSRWNLARSSSVPNFTLIGTGMRFTAPKTEKNFSQIFTVYARPQHLHNCSKFIDSFISINNKIINNLPRWGRFQPNFRRPLAAKLMMGPKKVIDLKWWHGPPLSPCKISWKSPDARQRERMKCDVFHFFCLFLFLKITLVARRPLWCVVELLPQDTTLPSSV